MITINGSCLCGGIQFTISSELGDAINCYCSMCRRAHGAAYATFAPVNPNHFTWSSGKDLVKVYHSSEEGRRGFCSICGSQLGSIREDGKIGYVTLGTIKDDPGVRAIANMYVGSKAPWVDILDDLKQFETSFVSSQRIA